ncbi:MAG: hypothetical protein NXI08_04915 [bacterium]|nr:hypothetical protein [bacterium]
MSNTYHPDIIYNDNTNDSIEVYIEEKGVRRDGLLPDHNGNTTTVGPNSNRELDGFSGGVNIKLVIQSKLVPASGNRGDGLKLIVPDLLKVHHIEMLRISGNKFELVAHFKSTKKSKMLTHFDPRVHHP